MICVKSLLAGAAVATLCAVVGGIAYVKLSMSQVLADFHNIDPNGGSYVANSPWIPIWPIVAGAVVIFAVTSYWAFQRISKPRQPQS